MSDVTRILSQIDSGDPTAADQLLPLVYDELRRLARSKLQHEQPGQTLEATALVHEAYLRLVGPACRAGPEPGDNRNPTPGAESCPPSSLPLSPSPSHPLPSPTPDPRLLTPNPPTPDSLLPTPFFHSRSHFFAAAAEAMRRILVESARRKSRLKRGGDLHREPIEDDAIAAPEIDADLLALDAALEKLAAKDPRKAELVKLRYFAGLTQQQAADVLGIGISTADRDWSYARAWLFREISK